MPVDGPSIVAVQVAPEAPIERELSRAAKIVTGPSSPLRLGKQRSHRDCAEHTPFDDSQHDGVAPQVVGGEVSPNGCRSSIDRMRAVGCAVGAVGSVAHRASINRQDSRKSFPGRTSRRRSSALSEVRASIAMTTPTGRT